MNEQRDLPQEAGYNLRRRHPDFEDYFAVWEAESVRVREALACTLDVRYGAGPNMTADLFPAPAGGAPIQVFIHGGYWRAMDKDVHSFPAEGFVAAGGAAVSLNYALAPAVTLDTIVEQCRTALEWVADNAGRLNGDPGPHLRLRPLSRRAPHRHDALHRLGGARAPGRSGEGRHPDLRHLRPGADPGDQHQRRCPARRRIGRAQQPDPSSCRRTGAPLIAAVGAEETPAFVAQNRAFAEAWQARGFEATVMEIEGLHHFNVVSEMGRPGSALTQAALAQMGL